MRPLSTKLKKLLGSLSTIAKIQGNHVYQTKTAWCIEYIEREKGWGTWKTSSLDDVENNLTPHDFRYPSVQNGWRASAGTEA